MVVRFVESSNDLTVDESKDWECAAIDASANETEKKREELGSTFSCESCERHFIFCILLRRCGSHFSVTST